MAGVETDATHPESMATEEEPLISNLDLFLFTLIAGIVIYWFMSRKKPEPIPEFKKLDTLWVYEFYSILEMMYLICSFVCILF